MDYLNIDLTDFLGIRCVDNADSLEIRHGGPKGKLMIVLVLSIEDGIMIW